MSLRMCKLPVTATGPVGAQTEVRPRKYGDASSTPAGRLTQDGRSSSLEFLTKSHGNMKPQEPAFASQFVLNKSEGPRIVKQIHDKPWTNSQAPGKRESPEGLNKFHRVWLTDGDRSGGRQRWNRERKKEYYAKKDSDLFAQVPTMEKFNRSGSHYVTWSHLLDGGTRSGGQEEKLDYTYAGWSRLKDSPSRPTEHFYLGKYENVKHVQRMIHTGAMDATGHRDELQRDTRSQFDNRLRDDMIHRNTAEQKWAAESSFEVSKPTATASVSQLGADFCTR